MKKAIAICTVGLMLALLLVACSTGKETSSQQTGDDYSSKESSEAVTGNISYRTDTFLGCTYQVPTNWAAPENRSEDYLIYVFDEANQIALMYEEGDTSDIDWEELRQYQADSLESNNCEILDSGIITDRDGEGFYILAHLNAQNGQEGFINSYYFNVNDVGIINLSMANAEDRSLYLEDFRNIYNTIDTSGFGKGNSQTGESNVEDANKLTPLYKDFFAYFEPLFGYVVLNEKVEDYFSNKSEEYDIERSQIDETTQMFTVRSDIGDEVKLEFCPANIDEYPNDPDRWVWTLSYLRYDSGDKAISIDNNKNQLEYPVYSTVDKQANEDKQEIVKGLKELESFMFE